MLYFCTKKDISLSLFLLRRLSQLPLGPVLLTSDCCLLQHQITSNFCAAASHKLNASNKLDKTQVPSLNPKKANEISPLNGEVVYNLRKMLVLYQRSEEIFFNLKR